MSKYRIISIDGGGVRGILAARILARLEAEEPGVIRTTDLFAGTSTGAIIALGLAKGLSSEQLVWLYQKKSAQIFQQSLLHDFGDLWGLIGAKYSAQGRYQGLLPTFGDAVLADLQKKVLIATFDLGGTVDKDGVSQWKARFFHNFAEGSDRVIDVVMQSSAAPTFFPIYQNSIDGGVVANNPSMCALAQAINAETGGQSLDDIVLLSIGTGSKPQSITSQDGDWGLEQWGFKIIDLLLDGGGGLADYQSQQLLGGRYLRINPPLGDSIPLDAVSRLDQLIQIADAYDLGDAIDWLKEYWFDVSGNVFDKAA